MKIFLTSLLLTVAGLTLAGAAPKPVPTSTSPIYINDAPLTTATRAPQIDARAFLNRSSFDVFTSIPFVAQNVLAWTNNGVMTGTPGYRFENDTTGKATGKKKKQLIANSKFLQLPSTVFYNDGYISGGSLVSINATNIINPGRIDVGEVGKIILLATNGTVDLVGGGLRVGAASGLLAPCNGINSIGTTFTSESSIVDQYWGAGRNDKLGTNGMLLDLRLAASIYSLPNPRTPLHEVLQPLLGTSRPFTNIFSLPSFSGCSTGYAAYVHTNFNNATSITVNVVFVATNSLLAPDNLFTEVRFAPVSGRAGFGYAPVVEFRSVDFDIVDQRLATNYVTFADSSAVATNITLLRASTFSTGSRTARRPSTYTWIAGRYCSFDFSETNNSVFDSGAFYTPFFRTNMVNTMYAADSVSVGAASSLTLGTTLLGVNPSLSDPTNFDGTINISAGNLNLSGARIRAADYIGIRTPNLISNTFAQLDAPFIDFDVRSTNSLLLVSNIAPTSVNRLFGNISVYSSVWNVDVTNFVSAPSTNGSNVLVAQLNNVRYHVLLVDNCLQSAQPVTINRFAASASNVVLADTLSINSGLKLEAANLTVEATGGLFLPAGSSLAFTNTRRLLNFTNHGLVSVPSAALFGDFQIGHVGAGNIPPLDNFVNDGFIFASSIYIRATNAQHTGGTNFPALLNANGGLVKMSAARITVTNAEIRAGSDLEIHGLNVDLRNTYFSAGITNDLFGRYIRGSLVIDATNSFGDVDGTMTTNEWFVTSGVRLPRRPAQSGNLLGTHITSTAGPLIISTIVWPGTNLGTNAAGFTNNLALGRLTLNGLAGNQFRFKSATSGNALYVDYLELLNDATNYNFALGVDADFTIYFADSNISPQKLDEISGGRVRWVNTYAGVQSSTSLVYPNGVTYTFNAGLVRNKDLDTDGDGVVNLDDCTPIPVPGFDTAGDQCALIPVLPSPLSASRPKAARVGVLAGSDFGLKIVLSADGQQAVLNWNAPARSASRVEFTESLAGGAWQTLTNFINGPDDARVTVRDAAGAPLRVYRVRVDAGKP